MSAITRYKKLVETAESYNESKYCAVVALAMALDITFEQSWTILKNEGRKSNNGTRISDTTSALVNLGVEFKEVRTTAKTVMNFSARGNYLVFTCNHALNHQYGETLDHSAGTRRRITLVYKIISIPVDLKHKLVAEQVVANKKPKPTKYNDLKYAMVHVETRQLLHVYSRKPSKPVYNLALKNTPNSLGKIRYIKFNQDLFIADKEAFWKIASLKSSHFLTKRDRLNQYYKNQANYASNSGTR